MGESRSRSFTLFAWDFILAFLLLCFPKVDSTKPCTSSCGDIHNISYPFRLKNDPKHCGDLRYSLSCENNITVLDLPPGKFHVEAINYHNQTIRLLDPTLDSNNCSSMPQNFETGRSPYGTQDRMGLPTTTPVFYLNCLNPVNSSLYVDTAPCLNSTRATSSSQPKTFSYVKVGPPRMQLGDLEEGCSAEWMGLALLDFNNYSFSNYKRIHKALMYGFELRVYTPGEMGLYCKGQWMSRLHNLKCIQRNIPGFFQYAWESIYGYFTGGIVYFDNRPWFPFKTIRRGLIPLVCIGAFFPARLIVGVPIVTVFLIYKWRRRHMSMHSIIEDFLQRDNNFMPIRYSYSDIKKMTSRFREKLGEGGYGSVFKGKLRSGRYVAIKILGKPKGTNGQDFISEVATIGRIHHVNVVQLVGYCVEGSKRAIVYDFMPNGSLDKYIFSKEGSIPLSCKKMLEISVGVARGIEYLHQGCDMQILHFDIKPHNILLDEKFNAKISDFGLAKLYPVDNSIVSLTAARGTMGYIAPELFYKNIGGVSYKADVYSFGMLLIEMASRRKNWNKIEMVEHSSQCYFPLWAYDQYNKGNDLETGNVTGEEKKTIKKMIITALWCIQMKPSDRPSMNKVVEMLGGDVECLNMPPRPFLYPHENEMHVSDIHGNSNPIGSNAGLTWTLSAR